MPDELDQTKSQDRFCSHPSIANPADTESLICATPETTQTHIHRLPASSAVDGTVATVQTFPVIAGYVVRSLLARGGMGCVYAARDLAFDREVAIKTLLPGANAERFLAESKITARLPHPGIPPVYALGVCADGEPFLAMKLVQGQTLAALLKSRSSPQDELPRFVQIFEQIAQAAGFAHSKSIIHRDLKPLNVMVGEFGEVQVMDWGLAKDGLTAPNNSPTDKSTERLTSSNATLTRSGAVLGTPAYMSPEQARGEEVDARADVFSLGAILAVILTGQPAFTGNTGRELIDKAAAADLTDVFNRLDYCGADAELASLAKHCLAAAPADRPADARHVATQVAEYRASVEKRLKLAETEKANALVRADEQAKRRRVVQFGAAMISAALICGIIGTTFGLVRAQIQSKEAKRQETEANKQKSAAQIKQQEAETNLGYAKKGNEILGSVFANLDENYETLGEFRSALRSNLDQAVKELESAALGDPLAVADMQFKLGMSLSSLGDAKSAIEVLEKVRNTNEQLLGVDHADTLAIVNHLGNSYREDGQLSRAAELLEANLKRSRDALGPDHAATLACMQNLAHVHSEQGRDDLALPLREESLSIYKRLLEPKNPIIFKSMGNLATTYSGLGRLDLALPLDEQVYEFELAYYGPTHPATLKSMANLARVYCGLGDLERALPLNKKAFELARDSLGAQHPSTLTKMDGLAACYKEQGQIKLALPLWEESLKVRKASLNADHPDVILGLNNLGTGYHIDGKLKESIVILEEGRSLAQEKLGEDHPLTLKVINNLALAYEDDGQKELALTMLQELTKRGVRNADNEHPDSISSWNNLAETLRKLGKIDSAISMHEATHEKSRAMLGDEHPMTLTVAHNLAAAYLATPRRTLAQPLFEEVLKGRRKKLGADHPETLSTSNRLARIHREAGRTEQALELLQTEVAGRKARLGDRHATTLKAMNDLASTYWSAKQLDKSVPLFEETLKLNESVRGRTHTETIRTKANLSVNYHHAGRTSEAIRLLQEAFQDSKAIAELSWIGFELLNLCARGQELDKARAVAEEMAARSRATISPDDTRLATDLDAIAIELLKLRQWSAAEPMLRESLSIRQLRDPDSWQRYNSESCLGGALLGRKEFAEAEPLLLSGYEGLKARQARIPTAGRILVTSACQRLVDLHTALDKPDDAQKWRQELDGIRQ